MSVLPSIAGSPSSSASTPATSERCAPWPEPVPRLVAEALTPVREPVAATLTWPAPAAPTEVAAALAQAAPPPPAASGDAPWLRPEQRDTARRLVGVLERHGGALLADPVGSGKTFVALAVAAALRGEAPAAAVVPAPLVSQWIRRASECGVPIEVLSHTAVSRGQLPDQRTRFVLIDECHHFRHPTTLRYAQLARFLIGRRSLGLSATPLVNRADDLVHQLLLGVRDDALRPSGTPSIRQALVQGRTPPSLGELVIATPPPAALPARTERRCGWTSGSATVEPPWLADLDALAIATRGNVAALIRCVLLSAAASSPAALRAALGRYSALLRHGLDARAAGIAVDRAALRRFTAEAPEQMLLWELMPAEGSVDGLPLEDLERVERLRGSIDLAAPDPKVELLRSLLADGHPTLVFTNAVATVPYLRDRLAELVPAWVTGGRAGWRHVEMPRDRILAWFQPGAPEVTPRVLLASDVAAEGLDLQRAERVIHYDLPWTAMRLAQREGRSRRLGGAHASIEVVRLDPPAWVERRLRIGAALRRKHLLGRRAGFEGTGSLWRWRHDLAAAWIAHPARAGVAAIRGTAARLLVGLRVEGVTAATRFALIDERGQWTESPKLIAGFLERARDAAEGPEVEWSPWRDRLAPFARTVLRDAIDDAWRIGPHRPGVRGLIARLQELVRRAAREREAVTLAKLERLLAFTARGHTAGESELLEEWAALDDEALVRNGDGLPEVREAVETGGGLQIVGAIVEVER